MQGKRRGYVSASGGQDEKDVPDNVGVEERVDRECCGCDDPANDPGDDERFDVWGGGEGGEGWGGLGEEGGDVCVGGVGEGGAG